MAFRIIDLTSRDRAITMTQEGQLPVLTSQGNYFTILIGKNGSGKSSLLSDICKLFLDYEKISSRASNAKRNSNSRNDRSFYMNFSVNGQLLNSDMLLAMAGPANQLHSSDWLPYRVIATTITPFDKFPLPPSQSNDLDSGEKNDSIYRYLGSRNRGNFSSKSSQISRVIESLIFATQKTGEDLRRLAKVFELLDLEPVLRLKYRLRPPRDAIRFILASESDEHLKKLVNDLFASNRYPSYSRSYFSLEDCYLIKRSLMSLDQTHLNGTQINLAINFEEGRFFHGSIDAYMALAHLRSLGLIRSSDFRILRRGSFDGEIDITDASSGQQNVIMTFLGIAGEISDNSLILLDEPEISLHPEWQERFLPLLSSTFSEFQGCHFVIATHSPLLISDVGNLDGSVVTMETGEIHDILEFSNRSADFQLATAFDAPGYRNEFLARTALSVLVSFGKAEPVQEETQAKISLLVDVRPMMNDHDPVAKMIDAIIAFKNNS